MQDRPKAAPPADLEIAGNARTVAAYEGSALSYAKAVSDRPSGESEAVLRRLAARAEPGRYVLEIGSGPGWDADFLEELGVQVRRTDITQAFRDFQAGRGRTVEALDVLSDALGGPYDGVMAQYVLQHIPREATDHVLAKIAGALRPGGAFLSSFREGTLEIWEHGDIAGDYLVVERSETEFAEALRKAGLEADWMRHNVDSDGAWLTVLASTRS